MVIVKINAKMCLLRFFSTIGIFSVWNFLSPRHQAAVWWKAIAHISMKRRLKVNGKFLASTTTLSIIFSKQRKKYICIYILYFNLKYFSLVIDFYSSIRLLKSQSSSQVFPGPLTWNGDPLPSSPPCFYTWSYTVFTAFEGVLKMISFILIF